MIKMIDVNFQYQDTAGEGCISELNLTISAGEVVLLCGASGCGKTTITRLINGLIPNYYEGTLEGQVLVDRKDVSRSPLYETAKQVGSVFQNPRSQFFTVDTTSELAFGCENQGLPESEIVSRIDATVNEFGIEPLVGRNIFHLSGGEKQKIACASVSVSASDIIVLDEPSSNLDVMATKDLRNMIAEWKRGGKTIIIAEHRLYYLRGLVDRILYLEHGKIMREFTERELLELPAEEFDMLGLRPFSLEQVPMQNRSTISKAILTFSGFRYCYDGKKEAVCIPELHLPKNEIIAVIGHNGAGKSTFARCVCGLEKKCKAVVGNDGKAYNRKKRLNEYYMVMQDVNHQLFTDSVLGEVLLGMAENDTGQAEQILNDLELLPYKDRHPMSLSGGQKQRLAIASALAAGRDVLVFDEPTSGLDLFHMAQVSTQLTALKQAGKTVIVITHDFELIARCCTYVLRLEQGQAAEHYPLDSEGFHKLKQFFLQ